MQSSNNCLPIDFHLVIPCFEESRRLPNYLDSLSSQLSRQNYTCQILVVDDGSSENEKRKLIKIIETLKNKHPLILDPIILERNYGKGYAVRTGWLAGICAKWLAFADADGATPTYEILRLFDFIHKKNDDLYCFFGSRIRMLGYSIDRDWRRHIVGRLYASLVGIIINQSVYDSQCGFKIVSNRAFQIIHNVLEENRFAFDSEVIAALSDAQFKLMEIPIDWRDVAGSKVSLIRDPVKMIISLYNIQKRRKKWTLKNSEN